VTADRVLRFVPPLIISRDEIDEACTILERVLLRMAD
jgi:4-aminobutyrate aminotransferase-like enzyme